ncbi:unnamed protein product [Adineta ricciae]|uniref:Chorein N-terminal domain-containing protein n=1 Tax=Adineta ricciae TaxID=249248 RepID=A0A814JPE1_ADIRI|nr:unnamed protein product [Adineta ricciae]CAF1299273.1 unnamed protein product [Adineta ricciae]
MFKLESYITPWLLSYIDRYVKLRREDFQLSLWGGDVVFYNLELRLANIQKLVPTLPIVFQSGIIHELRIHIPWIRINSEPIVVTINQIELVIVLNKECTLANDFPSSTSNEINSDQVLIQQQQPATPEQSNYVQTVLARILNNVQIVVNNLVVKFIEHDIVISLSSRTAQCYAANQNWAKAFIELTQQDLSLRRLISLPDITLCLDKRDLNGKVHRYEVPLLSRCSCECRIQMSYANVYQQLNTKPIQTRLSFYCANIEISIVDNQLSMLMRLIENIMLLIDQQIHSNGDESLKEFKRVPSKELSPPPSPVALPPPLPSLPPLIPVEEKTVELNPAEPGWISWAWSYVPSVTTLFTEEEDDPSVDGHNSETLPNEQQLNMKENKLAGVEEQNPLLMNNSNNNNTPTPILFAGIDIDRISLQYKVTKSLGNKSSHVPFIAFIVEKANIIVERYKPTSTTALDGQSVVSSVRKVKVSTSKMSLSWDECLRLSLSDVHFTLHYDRHVRMTRFSLIINDLHARLNHHLLIYPCQATLKLDHHQTYSLLHLEFSSLTGKLDFNILAYLITVINQIRTIVDVSIALFRPSQINEHVADDIISVDDLRNGSMKCLFQSSNDLPNTNEISFTTTNHHTLTSCMTWKYPERRSILKCHILPLPFHDDLTGVVIPHRIKTVDCLMQYWHFGTKQFVTWQTFELTDGQPLFLDFSNDLGQNPYSEMWRVVLVNASSIINQANSLAASTRIDSLQSQRYEPSLEMTIKIATIRVNFMIDPPKVKPSSKFQSILGQCQHDILTLHLDNISFDYSQRLETKTISIETILSLEALEYRFLTKRSCIEPALINLNLFIDVSKSSILTTFPQVFDLNNGKYSQLFRSAKTSFVCQLHFDIDHINIRLSQSLCHLINILYQQWIRSDMIKVLDFDQQTQEALALTKTDQSFYYTYYLFTNHLNCSIGLKQYDTNDKFLALQSSQTTDFIWSKIHTNEMLIQFSLEQFSSDPYHSSPINIHHSDNNLKSIVQFENSPHVFYLQSQYDQHQIRRHLHIFGKLIFKNLCNIDIDLKLYLNVGSRQVDISILAYETYASCLQTREDIEYIQWNSSHKYIIDQLNQDGIISTSDQSSIWIHLFDHDNFTCIVFTPIVIYRSFLTQSVLLHLNQEKQFVLESNGLYTYYYDVILDNINQVYEHRLQQIDAEQLTECIFQLNNQSYLSLDRIEQTHSDDLSLLDYLLELQALNSKSYSIIDLLRQEHLKVKSAEDGVLVPLIEQTNDILNPTISANGPVVIEPQINYHPKKTAPLINPTLMTTNSIDCRLESLRLYSHLNTILIQFKPSTLINNLTPFNFHLYANAGHNHVYIHSSELTCLSKFEYSQIQFVLIDPHDGEHIQCQTIDLFVRNIPMINPSTLINNRLYTNGSIDLYFIKSSNNDYFTCHVRHEYLDQTHILTIESKYQVCNRTNHLLSCLILPISKQQLAIDYPYNSFQIKPNEDLPLYRFQGVPSTDIHYYVLFQSDNNDKQYLSKPIRIFPLVDENGDRQCCCLFHKDDQIKSKSSAFQSLRGELFSIHQSIRTPTSQIELTVHSNPTWAFLQVINSCACPLLCRLENLSSMSHIIPPFSSAFIGIDSPESTTANSNANTLQNLVNGSRFYLAQFLPNEQPNHIIQLITNYFQQTTTKNVPWSRPIKIDSQFEDVFLPIPGLHDVLIRSLPASLFASRTLIIEPVHRQRSSKTAPTPKATKTNSIGNASYLSLPATTVISETTPRHYRSSMSERTLAINTSNATNQYLKAWHQQYNQANHRQVQLNFAINKISLSLMDELSDICLFREILRLTIDKTNLLFYQRFIDTVPCLHQQQLFCSIHQLQIDNQCYSPKDNYDFPVVLMSKDEKRVSKAKANVYESKERAESHSSVTNHHRQNSSSSVDTTVTEDPFPAFDSLSHNHKISRPIVVDHNEPKFLAVHFHRINNRFIKIDFQIQPFDVYIEDHYVYALLKIFSHLLPLDLATPLYIKENDPRVELIENKLLRTPFVCESLYIGPIDIVISVHASMKVYISCHQLPMFTDKFQKHTIYSANRQLLTLITRHYLMSLLTRSPLLLGSFDLLGNPSVFIRNITDGVYDLFHLPYVGMRQGPSGFMAGISQGATSLLKHFSLGTLTSVTTFANSVARNMDRLAMDSEHTTRNEETCRQIPTGMTSGLLQGLELFSLSLLGAIAGLAEQPLASFRNRDDSQAATTTVLSGVGKGLVGIVAKPVGGVAQLISQTGQGILYGTGLMNIPHRRHRQLEQDARINTTISYLKLSHSCQIAQNQDDILDILDYVLEHHNIEHGILILTKNRHLIVYHKDDEHQHGDYLLNDIELNESPDSSGLLVFNDLSFYVDSRLRHQFLALYRLIRQ